MKILQVHNRYRQPGGEDVVVSNEAQLLRANGHSVSLYEAFNPEDDANSVLNKIAQGVGVVWSSKGAQKVCAKVDEFRPDVVHFHNTFSVISPAAVRAVRSLGLPVVQTLHNYRLICANGLLMRNGAPCEQCISGSRLNGVVGACYRASRLASAAVAIAGAAHMAMGTYRGRGIRLVTLSQFSRDRLLLGGVDPNSIVVKPNFVFPSQLPVMREQKIIFVGRLAEEKGIDLIIDAWHQTSLGHLGWTLEVIGDGPLNESVRAAGNGIVATGWLAPDEVRSRIAQAQFLVMCSRTYEGMPMVALEALSTGTPLLLPRLGGMGEIIADGACGIGFDAGRSDALADAIRSAVSLSDDQWRTLSQQALDRYLDAYSPDENYRQLMAIYNTVLDECAA